MTLERKSKLLGYLVIAPLVSGLYIFLSWFVLAVAIGEAETHVKGVTPNDIAFCIVGFPFMWILRLLDMIGLGTNMAELNISALFLDAVVWAYFTVFIFRWIIRRTEVAK